MPDTRARTSTSFDPPACPMASMVTGTCCGRTSIMLTGIGGMPPIPVSMIEVRPQQVPVTIEAIGQAEGSKEVEVRARVSGILTKQLYKEGDSVKAGTTLFTIARAPYEIALAQARAAVMQDKANLERAQREATRLKPLVGEKAVSQKELDDATTALKAAEAALMSSEAKLRDAELNLSYTDVTAPISGVTGRAQRSEGSLITAGSDSSMLTTMNIIDPNWVRLSFSESETLQLRQATVKLVQPDGSTYGMTGKLNFAASTVDTRTGTVALRAEFPNPKQMLFPGQFVRVHAVVGPRDAYLVPQAALAQKARAPPQKVMTAPNRAAARNPPNRNNNDNSANSGRDPCPGFSSNVPSSRPYWRSSWSSQGSSPRPSCPSPNTRRSRRPRSPSPRAIPAPRPRRSPRPSRPPSRNSSRASRTCSISIRRPPPTAPSPSPRHSRSAPTSTRRPSTSTTACSSRHRACPTRSAATA